jgi:hypothetical protein
MTASAGMSASMSEMTLKSPYMTVVQRSPGRTKRPVIDLDARHMLAMSKVCGLTVAVIGFALTVIWKL